MGFLRRWLGRGMARDRVAIAGEDLAVRHLEGLGYRIVDRRVRTRSGEIDIVAEHGERVVFVEVKTRRSRRFAAAEAVSPRQIERLRRTAMLLLGRPGLRGRPCRFDLVEVTWPDGEEPTVVHRQDVIDRGSC